MQSGISASKELVSQFNDFLKDTSTFGLLVTIADEALTPVAKLPSSSSDFKGNLAQLSSHLQPNEALYLILRRYESSPQLIAITYVPDAAKVRQKMLFASTRLTLVRELGSEHFKDTILTTYAEEMTPAGFDKHDKHQELDAPLTEEEKALGEIKRAEAEAGHGTGVKQIHLSNHMNMPISPEALTQMAEFSQNKGVDLLMLKINKETEVIELVPDSSTPSSITELVKVISPSEPRFTFYRYIHTHDGTESSPVLFFYTCPTESAKAIKYRMMYPLMKRAVITVAENEANITVEKKFEVEEPTEITEESVMEELHPKPQVKTGFKRPKRPGR